MTYGGCSRAGYTESQSLSMSHVELQDFQVECEGRKEGIKDNFTKISGFSI